jgi:hypothetical protein
VVDQKLHPEVSSNATMRYPSEPPVELAASSSGAPPPPPPPSGGRTKTKAAPRSIFRSPSTTPSGVEVFLPTTENAEITERTLSKVIKTNLKTPSEELKANELAKDVGQNVKAKVVAPRPRGRPRKTPELASGGAKKPVIKFVRIAGGPPKVMGVKTRGRPKGAFGKAKRDRLEKEALESSSMA